MYLTQKHFNNSLLFALFAHLLFLIIYAVNFQSNYLAVLDKPIYIKIGTDPNAGKSTGSIPVKNPEESKGVDAPPKEIVLPAALIDPPVPAPEPIAKPEIIPPVEKIEPVVPSPVDPVKIEKSSAKKSSFVPRPQTRPVPPPPLVMQYRDPQMTGDAAPSQVGSEDVPFVQNLQSGKYEVEGVRGNPLGNRTQAEQVAIEKYEQKLALWLQMHHVYPLAARQKGMEGDAVVRMQIDRLGNIRFYELAEPTPFPELDEAVIRMIERSDPVPPLPDDYPGDFVIEFLVPVSFKLRDQQNPVNIKLE